MKKNKKILILNTGGTLTKVYNELTGKLIVPKNNNSIEAILKKSKLYNLMTYGIIFKDSLDLNKQNRKEIANYIFKSSFEKIIIVHGTDTMNKTAKYLSKRILNKTIILTGSMIPFEIDPIEATSNLMTAYGFIQNCKINTIYISMHGLIKKYNKIKKNRELGIFQ